jgi:hypothetical protein
MGFNDFKTQKVYLREEEELFVFEFFMGFNDFKTQKVYLLRFMPVYVGLSMVSCLF